MRTLTRQLQQSKVLQFLPFDQMTTFKRGALQVKPMLVLLRQARPQLEGTVLTLEAKATRLHRKRKIRETSAILSHSDHQQLFAPAMCFLRNMHASST